MSRIIRSARPDAINAHDRARMAAHVARADRKRATARAWSRLAALVAASLGLALAVSLFYSTTGA